VFIASGGVINRSEEEVYVSLCCKKKLNKSEVNDRLFLGQFDPALFRSSDSHGFGQRWSEQIR